jgi:hypothetical protein
LRDREIAKYAEIKFAMRTKLKNKFNLKNKKRRRE